MTAKYSPIIWYIPGLYSSDDPQDKALQILQTIYSDAEEITNISWENQNGTNIELNEVVSEGASDSFNDSNPWIGLLKYALEAVGSINDRWNRALDDVRTTAELLAHKIANDLSDRQRQNLILVGHSLGGNIAIRTMAHLHRQNLSVKSAVLLGAAIDYMDKDIPMALNATHNPVYSIINPNDAALKLFHSVTGRPALGTQNIRKYNDSRIIEHFTTSYFGHSSVFYLSQWAEINNVKLDYNAFTVQLIEDAVNYLRINIDDEDCE